MTGSRENGAVVDLHLGSIEKFVTGKTSVAVEEDAVEDSAVAEWAAEDVDAALAENVGNASTAVETVRSALSVAEIAVATRDAVANVEDTKDVAEIAVATRVVEEGAITNGILELTGLESNQSTNEMEAELATGDVLLMDLKTLTGLPRRRTDPL
jgi:hypothetical protein